MRTLRIKYDKKAKYIAVSPSGGNTVEESLHIYHLLMGSLLHQGNVKSKLTEELERLGYDLTTFDFSIKKKK